MIDLHIDIETGDPDDLWTLALLSTHPRINIIGVSVFPGGRDQIGLVKKVLKLTGRGDVLVGANHKNDNKSRVSEYYYKWLGDLKPSDPDIDLLGLLEKTKGCRLFTGGPLSNIHVMQKNSNDVLFEEWMCQGGFVGSNILSGDNVLDKFKDQKYVPTFNLNGDPKASLSLLSDYRFKSISMVGKNVCHGFFFDEDDISFFEKGKHAGLDLMIDGVEFYKNKNKTHKKAMHDILAALLMINPNNGNWVRGNPVREKGMWGFELNDQSNIKALISIDKKAVLREVF
jgi:pyrimidine-specific ribonucleoside hydrolase